MTLNPDDLAGRTAGPYTLERLIGQGGFAWVFAARDSRSDAPSAVKVLKPRYAGDRQFESRFRNEFTIAAEFKHPNIVGIRDVGQDGEMTFFAMDLYPDSLGSLLTRESTIPEPRLLQIAIDITTALVAAHEAGIVHRDIKVDNILLTSEGTAVLADFGIARAVSGYVTATGVNMTIGTPHYVSPEQAQGRPLDGRSDLYALGVTMYKAATGELPFRSTDWFELARMHVEDPPVAPRERRPELSGRLERVILRCLAKHPDDRYSSARELLDALEKIAGGTVHTSEIPVPQRRGSPPVPTSIGVRRARRVGWLFGALAVVLVVALLVVVLGRR